MGRLTQRLSSAEGIAEAAVRTEHEAFSPTTSWTEAVAAAGGGGGGDVFFELGLSLLYYLLYSPCWLLGFVEAG